MVWTWAMAFAADGESLQRAAELPVVAQQSREQGVPAKAVAIEAIRSEGRAPEEASEGLEEARRDLEENGPIDTAGAFGTPAPKPDVTPPAESPELGMSASFKAGRP